MEANADDKFEEQVNLVEKFEEQAAAGGNFQGQTDEEKLLDEQVDAEVDVVDKFEKQTDAEEQIKEQSGAEGESLDKADAHENLEEQHDKLEKGNNLTMEEHGCDVAMTRKENGEAKNMKVARIQRVKVLTCMEVEDLAPSMDHRWHLMSNTGNVWHAATVE